MLQPQSKRQESRQNADNKKTANTAQLQKRIASQQATIAQKDKTYSAIKKTACRYAATDTPSRMSKRR
jgi:hypothetical protein